MEIGRVEYPPYPYQKRKQYEVRLTEAFPIEGLMKRVEKEIEIEDLKNFKEFQFVVEAHKFEKEMIVAKRYINLYEDYIEAAFESPKERLKKIYLPYRYEFSTIRSGGKREMRKGKWGIDYSKTYLLRLKIFWDHKKWFFNFLNAFFYCQAIHRLDLIKLEIKAETREGKIKTLSSHELTKTIFRMPIWGPVGFEEITKRKLKEIFSNQLLLETLADQLRQRYPFVWCLTLNGEPIPRRYRWVEIEGKMERRELEFNEPKDIAEFFNSDFGVEYYRSADKKGIEKVDTLILEYDPPLIMENEAEIWKRIVEDEERDIQLLIDYGINPDSIEENFSGNKSLQRLIHISPPISYQKTRDVQIFLANFHKFEAAKDSYFYTLDKDCGLARVTKTLPDYTYGRKKEIKCVPVPNIKREPVHCSIPLEFSIENGKIKFADWVFDLKKVREFSRWENVREKLIKDEALPQKEKVFKRQSFFEKNATDSALFDKLMDEFYWYERASKQIPPHQLDLWKKEWIRERFK
jgi:hypothetical protein